VATGTGNLPNDGMSFSPFAILTAEEMNDLVENIESLADGTGIGDGSVPVTALTDGVVVQVVSTNYSAVATGAGNIPLDDSVPQNTEGNEFMTLAITPKSATNILVIEVIASLASDAAAFNMNGALFQDTTAGALAANSLFGGAASASLIITIKHTMVAGTTSATTFKFRGGANTGTTTFNGRAAGRLFGAITKSSITITEYKAS
jgi:hypothetical protein